MNPTILKRRSKGVLDEALVRREIYNPNKFDVIFTRQMGMDKYIIQSGITLGPAMVRCKADDFCTLNHGYYVPTATNGAPYFDMVQKFGDSIGNGDKLPSLPTVGYR